MGAHLASDLILDENAGWRVSNEAFVEAAEDSMSLQAIVDNLLDFVLRSHDDMQQTMEATEEPSQFEMFRLRHLEELIRSIETIQTDVDDLVEGYRHPPLKSFVRSSYDQLRAIYRLSHLLSAIRPFLPIPNHPRTGQTMSTTHEAESPNGMLARTSEVNAERADMLGISHHPQQGQEAAKMQTSCLDREPRSSASLPSGKRRKTGSKVTAPPNQDHGRLW